MKHFLVAALLLAGFAWFTAQAVNSSPYFYDEADYMFARSRGFIANYLDNPAQSFADYLRTGLSRGTDPAQKLALSEAIRNSGDINFYRHWHGPLYSYWLLLAGSLGSDEHGVRTLSMVIPGLGILLIYFGTLRLFTGACKTYAAFLAAALYGWSAVTVRSTELAPHELFVLTYLGALFLLARSIQTGRRRYWYGAIVLTALAAATLEVALVLILTLAAVGYWQRNILAADWRFALKSSLLLLVSVVLVWPGALLKLAFLKAYIFMAYLALFRRNPWSATFTQAWAARAGYAPVEWVLFLFAVYLWLRYKQLRESYLAPYPIFAILMLLFLIRVNAAGPRYMLPFIPAIDVFSALIVVRWLELRRAGTTLTAAFTGCTCLVLLLNTWGITRDRASAGPDHREAELLAGIRASRLENKKLLVPHADLPMLHYYLPNGVLIPYADGGQPPSGVTTDAIVYPGYPVRIVIPRP